MWPISGSPASGALACARDRRHTNSWFWVLAAITPPLVAGGWDRPVWAVPGAVLLVIAAVVQVAAREREAHAGRRWLADPPGPLRT